MKAVVLHEYGAPEVLAVEEVAKPEPIPTEVQVRVHAAGVNPVDFKTRAGKGMAGLLGEPPVRLGWDVAGVVSEVAPGVTRFKVGEEVFGMPWFPRQAGAYAEYVTAPSRHFATKPHVLSHEEAAALPLAGLTAWQIVVDTIALEAGADVLIHGAAGGVGHLAVQIAKARGAYVIGTASAAKHGLLRELGADEVIDYRAQDFTEAVAEVDVVLDGLGGEVARRSLEVLKPGGRLVTLPGPDDVPAGAAERGVHAAWTLVEPDRKGLEEIAALADRGLLRPLVETVLPLEQAAKAHEIGEQGRTTGKIVLTVA
jgi:NADPH:quinone reductase-like Zn-dependent oxidoreductase